MFEFIQKKLKNLNQLMKAKKIKKENNFGLKIVLCAFFFAALVLVVYSFTKKDIALLMLSFSSSAIGGLFGLLFGIPVYRPSSEEGDTSKYDPNTNLEQISDWLTKILVGIGLTQMPNAARYLSKIVLYIQQSQKENDEKSLILNTIIYFLIVGFFGGYLWSRLILKGELEKAENTNKIVQEELSKQDELNSIAASKVFLYLSGENIRKEGKSEEYILIEVLREATINTRINIYYQTHEVRRVNSPFGTKNLSRMSRTINIFSALIKTYEEQSHIESELIEPIDRYYGELGYALKDIEDPRLREAIRCFNEAIYKRDYILKRENPIKWFEFNRMICYVRLPQNEQDLIAEFPAKITNDLEAVVESSAKLRRILDNLFQESDENLYDDHIKVRNFLKCKIQSNDEKTIEVLQKYSDDNRFSEDFVNLKVFLESQLNISQGANEI